MQRGRERRILPTQHRFPLNTQRFSSQGFAPQHQLQGHRQGLGEVTALVALPNLHCQGFELLLQVFCHAVFLSRALACRMSLPGQSRCPPISPASKSIHATLGHSNGLSRIPFPPARGKVRMGGEGNLWDRAGQCPQLLGTD